jgi:starvation-inducible DNA-binding protein
MIDSYEELPDPKKKLAKGLYTVVANTVSFAFRAQAFHWNVKGKDFHQYHDFFRVIYEEVFESIDGLAEYLRILGHDGPMSLQEIANDATIECGAAGSDPADMVRELYYMNEKLLGSFRAVQQSCGSEDDTGALGAISDRIKAHSKWAWQLRTTAGLDQELVDPEVLPVHVEMPESVDVVPMHDEYDPMFAAVAPEDCPPATQDIVLNLDNRKKAIDGAMYGPLNPAEPNDEYWQELASEWNVDADTARQQTCANCAMFNISDNMKSCIEAGVTGDRETDDFDAIDAAGELGYCEAFDFKCASARTCRAWVGGGPVTASALIPEEKALAEALKDITNRYGKFDQDGTGVWAGYTPASENQDAAIGVKCENCVFYSGYDECQIIALEVEAGGKCRFAVIPEGVVQVDAPARDFDPIDIVTLSAAADSGPCWDGYIQIGMKEKDGKLVPNCVPEESSEAQTFGNFGTIGFSKPVEEGLRERLEGHNKKAPADLRITISILKAVYRRGARSYSNAQRFSQTRGEWAMTRVDAYVRLLKAGEPANPSYTEDNDLLPPIHPRSTAKAVDISELNLYAKNEIAKNRSMKADEFASVEEAVVALSELSGLGYESEFALKSAWTRAVESSENPFERAKNLAVMTYKSADADLLPERNQESAR